MDEALLVILLVGGYLGVLVLSLHHFLTEESRDRRHCGSGRGSGPLPR
jgi:hypothetical protein